VLQREGDALRATIVGQDDEVVGHAVARVAVGSGGANIVLPGDMFRASVVTDPLRQR
jgi:hypothetical protein